MAAGRPAGVVKPDETEGRSGGPYEGREGLDDEDDLALAARFGSEEAFEELYRRLYPKVFGFFWHQLGRLDRVEEAAADLFVAVYQGITRFEARFPGSFRAWVFSIARNQLAGRFRREARHREFPTGDISTLVADSAASASDVAEALRPGSGWRAEVGAELEEAVARLSESQRTCLLLRFVADLSLAQTAEVMEMNVNSVKQLQHRAIEAMRRDLGAGLGVMAEEGDAAQDAGGDDDARS